MKLKIINFITIAIFITSLSACEKEYINPDSNLTCSANFQNHPKNSQYQALLDDYAAKGFIGLTLLIDNPSDGLWMGSAGYANIESNIKMNPCHLHHTASIYKTYIAVIIMQMVEEGKISLDDKLGAYISPEILNKLPNGNKVTIRNLLQHRSGMQDVFEIDFLMDFFNNPLKLYSIDELLKYVYNKNPKSEPGTDFYYSDANFALLSLVINKIDGSYIQSLKSRIFQPLNLTETFVIESPGDAPATLANSYWDRYGDGKIENVSDIQIALTCGLKGTDGIVSSARDMEKFIQALVKGGLVSDASLEKMTAFVDVPETVQQQLGITAYGLGLMKVNINEDTWYGHFGNHVGSGAIALYNPEKDVTLVVFQNKGTFFSDEIKPLFFYQLIKDIEEIVLF